MEVINLNNTDNYPKCEALKKLGYEVKSTEKSCWLTSKKYKNLDKFINVYYRNVDEILIAFKKDLSIVGYTLIAA